MNKKVWVSSDYHWNHTNILKYDMRPFKDIGVHDQFILNNHNAIVEPNDDFYFLGDLAFFYTKGEKEYVEDLLKNLKGNKFFIKGNHDHKDTVKLYQKYGTYLGEKSRIKVNDVDIIIDHFPNRTWNRSHHGSFHLYGHHHGDIETEPWGRSRDVGIMLNDYRPFDMDDIIAELSNRPVKFIEGDHHKSVSDMYNK